MIDEELKLKDAIFYEVHEASHTGRVAGATERIWLLIKQAGYAKLAKDHSLPELPKQYRKSKYVSDVYGDGWRNGYTWLKNKIKDGFRKVED